MLWFFISLVSLLVLVYVLLWLPPIQRLAVNIALKEVMKITKSEISVGDIKFRPFSKLKLSDVYAADLKGDTLLYVKDISAEFSLLPLLSSKLQVNSVSINDFTIQLNADSLNGDLNFQFFVDAFSSDEVDTTTSSGSAFVINLDNISLTNGRVSYDILSEPAVSKEFDYNHIHIDSLLLATDFSFTSVEDFMVKLKHLSLKERSGFQLKELTADVTSGSKRMQLSDFVFRLAKSEIRIDQAYVDYSSSTFDSLATSATFKLPIDWFVLHPSDIAMFYPPMKSMKDSLLLGVSAEGTLPEVNLDSFYLILGRTFSVDANAYIADYINWENTPLELNIGQLLLDTKRLSRLTRQLASTGTGSVIDIPVNTDFVNLKALLKGILPDMQIDLNIITSSGALALNGQGGYVFSTGDAHLDGKLAAQDFNVAQLLADTTLGIVSIDAVIKGRMSGSGDIAATLNTNVNRFDYNGYSYRDIYADALYAGDSLRFLAEIKDRNVPLWLKARGKNITADNPYLYLEAEAKHIKFDSLNFIPQYKGADLYALVQAEVQNFDLEKMKASLSIDSLQLATDRGVFYQDSLRLKMDNQESGYKKLTLDAPIIEAALDGTFSLATLPIALSNSLSQYFNAFIPYQAVDSLSNDDLNLYLLLRNTEYLSNVLELPAVVNDSLMISAYYNNRYNNVLLSAAIPKLTMNGMELVQTVIGVDNDTLAPKVAIFARTGMPQEAGDTVKVGLMAKALGDSVNIRAAAGAPSDALALFGFVDADVHFTAKEDSAAMPLIDVGLNPGVVYVNRQRFDIMPSSIQIDDDRYVVSQFELADTSGGNIKINGVVSPSSEDVLDVTIDQLYLSSIMAALQSDIDLKGEINADIGARNILSNPIVSTNYFNVNNIAVNNKSIGNLEIGSAWDNQQEAVMLDAELWQTNGNSSRINGYVYPTKDRLSLTAYLRKLELDWVEPITRDYLFGLSGGLGMELTAEGALGAPDLNGKLLFDNANIGVKMTNVQYKLSDTIPITPNKIAFNQFKIVDNTNNTATINGSIGHKSFSDLDLGLNVRLRNFLLLNNPNQKDSMIYGKLGLNGTIDISGSSNNMLAKASISNSGSGRVFLQLPESARTAQQYTGITYINTDEDTTTNEVDGVNRIFESIESSSVSLPLRVELALTLTPELTAGMVINQAAGDIASASGSGNIQLIYDMMKDDMSLHGDYTISKGSAAFSFQNVLKKQFQLANGGKVTFRGDPMATRFNATAIYSLRADLATLDENFTSDPYLSSSRVQVNCLINISGDLDNMALTYDISIPNVDESVQRKVEGLLYNDDLKIKQIAYLLALGRFYPPEGVVGASSSNTWTSLLSSTLSTQLNSLLSNVLNENWSVGTELRAGEDGGSDIEANVMVSANLFNNRVTVTTNLGYRNTATASDDFTGDFSVEYKLTKSGEWVIKAYNVTNDQFYEQAPTTQGVGVVYRKEAKTFKGLFKKRRRRSEWRNREVGEERRNRTEQRSTTEQGSTK